MGRRSGVAKTTTVINLAYGLSCLDKKVLIIDLDIQGQCTLFLGKEAEHDVFDVVTEDTTFDEALVEAREELFILPGGPALSGLKHFISQREFAREKTLVEALEKHIERWGFDYVLIDTAPGLDLLNICGMFLADHLIIPVLAEPASVHSFSSYIEKIKEVMEYHPIDIAHVIPTAMDRRYAVSNKLLKELAQYCGSRMTQPIRTASQFKTAVDAGQAFIEFAPNDERARDYEDIVFKILEAADE